MAALLRFGTDKSICGKHTILVPARRTTRQWVGRTTTARAKLNDVRRPLDDVRIQEKSPVSREPLSSLIILACASTQADDGISCSVALGDHYSYRDQGREKSPRHHPGHLDPDSPDGSVPFRQHRGSPIAPDAKPKNLELWAIANVRPARDNPAVRRGLWEIEHGPRGGDESNVRRQGPQKIKGLGRWDRPYGHRLFRRQDPRQQRPKTAWRQARQIPGWASDATFRAMAFLHR